RVNVPARWPRPWLRQVLPEAGSAGTEGPQAYFFTNLSSIDADSAESTGLSPVYSKAARRKGADIDLRLPSHDQVSRNFGRQRSQENTVAKEPAGEEHIPL